MNLRNVAIIAHVDHGKTTLVDGLLKQSKTFRANEAEAGQELIMDSNDQERERGITILAKNTAIEYRGTKINIIDTPGHADFGGEVERTLNMADGALLLVDAQEGPMPQTKFVLKKALEAKLKIIVIINKIDKKTACIEKTLSRVSDLFLELASSEEQLDFPVLYAIGREGKAWEQQPEDITKPADLSPVFAAILNNIPAPSQDTGSPLQLLVSALEWDDFQGKYAIGRITRGRVAPSQRVLLLKPDGSKLAAQVGKVYVNKGLHRVEIPQALAGDIVALTGIADAEISDTVASADDPEALPTIKLEEPTLSISIGPNTSPFKGREGKFLTSRQILKRIKKELQTNIAMRLKIDSSGQMIISGRGELHITVFLETLRREGFEIEVGKPQVIIKTTAGEKLEPIEELTCDIEDDCLGVIQGEIGRRRGTLISQEKLTENSSRLVFKISTRGLLGSRNTLLTLSKGTAVLSSLFLGYEKMGAPLPENRKGVLLAAVTGKATVYGLRVAQGRGTTFVGPKTEVYGGMIIGANAREEDIEINVCKEKRLTNVRSAAEETIVLPHAVLDLSLEQCFGFLAKDELLEITPKSLRLRKRILDHTARYRTAHRVAK